MRLSPHSGMGLDRAYAQGCSRDPIGITQESLELCRECPSVCVLLCCKNLWCASRFCTGGRPAVGSKSKQMCILKQSIAIHLQFVLQCASSLYCSAFGAPTLLGKRNTVSTPPICIAVRLPFLLQYASHSYRSTFGKILVFAVLSGHSSRE